MPGVAALHLPISPRSWSSELVRAASMLSFLMCQGLGVPQAEAAWMIGRGSCRAYV